MPSNESSSFMQSRVPRSGTAEPPGRPSRAGDEAASSEPAIHHVLVPLDGSPLAECALPWAVAVAQPVLWLAWRVLPRTRPSDALKLAIFVGILATMGRLAYLGRLPRTRPIVPGEWASLD